MATTYNNFSKNTPDISLNVGNTFGIDADFEVPAFAEANEYVPDVDDTYCFDKSTTLAILAGFSDNRRVMIQGLHGSGKSTHIEQVAARLNWPCVRINLDSHISRLDLLGKDAITLEKDKQVTKFQEGILPWAIQNPTALVFDEYDAGRPDVMFVIQRVLEVDGRLTLLDQNRVLTPNPFCYRKYCRSWRQYWSLSRNPTNQSRSNGQMANSLLLKLFERRIGNESSLVKSKGFR